MKTFNTSLETSISIFSALHNDFSIVVGSEERFTNESYIPQPSVLEKTLRLLNLPNFKSIALVGETGTGKSELVSYIASAKGFPMETIQVTGSSRADELFGSMQIAEGNTSYVAYPWVKLYEQGGIILLDEVDKASPEFSAALHPLLEGKDIVVDGRRIAKHDDTRIICTTNTVGDGTSARYVSSQQLDSAVRNRLAFVRCDYPSSDVELEILSLHMPPALHLILADKMVQLGNLLRDGLLGSDRMDSAESPFGNPFSTRDLVSWAQSIRALGLDFTLQDSFDAVYGAGLDTEDTSMVNEVINRCFGDMWGKSLSEYFDPSSANTDDDDVVDDTDDDQPNYEFAYNNANHHICDEDLANGVVYPMIPDHNDEVIVKEDGICKSVHKEDALILVANLSEKLMFDVKSKAFVDINAENFMFELTQGMQFTCFSKDEKTWAISVCGNFVIYTNPEVTDSQIINQVNAWPSRDARILDKDRKGYTQDAPKTWDQATFSLV